MPGPLAVAVYFLLWRTTIGYRIRAVGLNPHASRYVGIPVSRYVFLSMVLSSGAFWAWPAPIEVMGVHHRMIEGMSGGYGFSGIVAALFGKLHLLGAIPKLWRFLAACWWAPTKCSAVSRFPVR